MLEGNEVEQKLGDKGSLLVDVKDSGIVEVKLAYADGGLKAGSFVELDVVSILEALAKKTTTSVDDAMVASVKAALGR
jgi:hypothetical protein